MKNKLIITQCFVVFLLASATVVAQTNTPTNNRPQAKVASDDNILKPAAKNIMVNVKEVAKVKTLPFQKAEQPAQSVVSAPPNENTTALKAVSINVNAQKINEPKNIDRPKTSTLQIQNNTPVEQQKLPVAEIIKVQAIN